MSEKNGARVKGYPREFFLAILHPRAHAPVLRLIKHCNRQDAKRITMRTKALESEPKPLLRHKGKRSKLDFPVFNLIRVLVLKPGFHMITNDRRRSRIADRRRSQRMLFPYNRKRSQRKVLSHTSVLGNYENYGLWAILWLELISEMLNSH